MRDGLARFAYFMIGVFISTAALLGIGTYTDILNRKAADDATAQVVAKTQEIAAVSEKLNIQVALNKSISAKARAEIESEKAKLASTLKSSDEECQRLRAVVERLEREIRDLATKTASKVFPEFPRLITTNKQPPRNLQLESKIKKLASVVIESQKPSKDVTSAQQGKIQSDAIDNFMDSLNGHYITFHFVVKNVSAERSAEGNSLVMLQLAPPDGSPAHLDSIYVVCPSGQATEIKKGDAIAARGKFQKNNISYDANAIPVTLRWRDMPKSSFPFAPILVLDEVSITPEFSVKTLQ
jgi:hypothetical protein